MNLTKKGVNLNTAFQILKMNSFGEKKKLFVLSMWKLTLGYRTSVKPLGLISTFAPIGMFGLLLSGI